MAFMAMIRKLTRSSVVRKSVATTVGFVPLHRNLFCGTPVRMSDDKDFVELRNKILSKEFTAKDIEEYSKLASKSIGEIRTDPVLAEKFLSSEASKSIISQYGIPTRINGCYTELQGHSVEEDSWIYGGNNRTTWSAKLEYFSPNAFNAYMVIYLDQNYDEVMNKFSNPQYK